MAPLRCQHALLASLESEPLALHVRSMLVIAYRKHLLTIASRAGRSFLQTGVGWPRICIHRDSSSCHHLQLH